MADCDSDAACIEACYGSGTEGARELFDAMLDCWFGPVCGPLSDDDAAWDACVAEVCAQTTAACEQDRPVPPCEPDAWEPNESLDTATPLALPGEAQGALCAEDQDWFSLAPQIGQAARVTLRLEPGAGDLDLELYTESGALLMRSSGVGASEQVVGVAPDNGELAVRVVGWQAATGSYSLDATAVIADPGCPADDPYEDNDVFEQATVLVGGGLVRGRACSGDPDLYGVYASAGRRIVADLRFLHANGDLDLRLLGPDELQIATSLTVNDDEHLEHLAAEEGLYVLEVWGFRGVENAYWLELALD